MIKNLIMCVLSITLIASAQYSWIETTQEDFRDGTFERNIYASTLYGGTIEFAPRFDLNNDGYIDLFTAKDRGPYARIHWGSPSGYHTLTRFPTTGAANCDAADLNNDGYPDFVVSHSMTPKVTIYWGTPTGPDTNQCFDIPTSNPARQGIFIADFDKDGNLDIVTSQEYVFGYSAVFWGDESGYDLANRTDLPSSWGVHNIEVADFNSDTWLDILIIEYQNPYNTIYWGSIDGFSASNYTHLPGPGSHGSSVADLNQDGMLDLVFTAWDYYLCFIYWGDTSGYSTGNMRILFSGYCYGGSAIADINGDDFLDILFHDTEWPKIYWGSAEGYSDTDTTYIGFAHVSSGGLIADLNNDDTLDFFSNTFNSNRSHIFWGPSFTSDFPLSAGRDHHAMFREIGNVYNRKYNEFYLSSVFDASKIVNWGIVEWDANLPSGTSIDFMARTGNTPSHDTTWSTWFALENGDSLPDSLNSQYIQYMALLKYINPAYLPSLYEVRVLYDTLLGVYAHNDMLPQGQIAVFPNPFSSKTNISYTVTKPHSKVSIKTYDITGRCVRTLIDTQQGKGTYSIEWNGKDGRGRTVAKGLYFLVIKRDEGEALLKVVRIDK